MEDPAGPGAAEDPVGCKRAGLACKRSSAAAVEPAKDKAGEGRGSSFDGRGLDADPIVSLVATGGEEAVVTAHGAGIRSVLAVRRRA